MITQRQIGSVLALGVTGLMIGFIVYGIGYSAGRDGQWQAGYAAYGETHPPMKFVEFPVFMNATDCGIYIGPAASGLNIRIEGAFHPAEGQRALCVAKDTRDINIDRLFVETPLNTETSMIAIMSR